MSRAARRWIRASLLGALFVALPVAALAHRLDEYLQATLVFIEPESVTLQLNLIPGEAVANRVLALIDRNGDGVLSPEETARYARTLQQELSFELDHRPLALQVTSVCFPEITPLRSGSGVIQVELQTVIPRLSRGPHMLEFANRHLPAGSAYLFNAAKPKSTDIGITAQKRNPTQSTGEIEFAVR